MIKMTRKTKLLAGVLLAVFSLGAAAPPALALTPKERKQIDANKKASLKRQQLRAAQAKAAKFARRRELAAAQKQQQLMEAREQAAEKAAAAAETEYMADPNNVAKRGRAQAAQNAHNQLANAKITAKAATDAAQTAVSSAEQERALQKAELAKRKRETRDEYLTRAASRPWMLPPLLAQQGQGAGPAPAANPAPVAAAPQPVAAPLPPPFVPGTPMPQRVQVGPRSPIGALPLNPNAQPVDPVARNAAARARMLNQGRAMLAAAPAPNTPPPARTAQRQYDQVPPLVQNAQQAAFNN